MKKNLIKNLFDNNRKSIIFLLSLILIIGISSSVYLTKSMLKNQSINNSTTSNSITSNNTTLEESKTQSTYNNSNLARLILGHWSNNNGLEYWYSSEVYYSKERADNTADKHGCSIISDRQTKNDILNTFKDKYIYIDHSTNNIEKIKYNFTDDMIDNSIIIKTYLNNGNVIENLIVFSSDKKSYKSYFLNYSNVKCIELSPYDEFHFIDSSESL